MSTREERIAEMDARRNARIKKRIERDKLIREGVICGFSLTWHGRCEKPAIQNGRCEEHKDVQCRNCGKRATKECDHIGMLVCGYPICDSCGHPHGQR